MEFLKTKTAKTIGGALLFFASLIFFLFMTFPYEVVKESVAAEIMHYSGYTVSMDDLGPALPLGMTATNVRVESPNGEARFTLSRATLRVGVWSLLLGRLGLDLSVQGGDGGTLSIGTSLNLFKLTFSKQLQLSGVDIEANQFVIDSMMKFLLSTLGSSDNPLLGPTLKQLSLKGKLHGTVSLDLNPGNPAKSEGAIDIKLVDAVLKISGMDVADQAFSKALIKGKMINGTLTLDNASGFVTEDLNFGINGSIILAANLSDAKLNMTMPLKLDKSLKTQFGTLLDAFAGGVGTGTADFHLRGTFGAPDFKTM